MELTKLTNYIYIHQLKLTDLKQKEIFDHSNVINKTTPKQCDYSNGSNRIETVRDI